VKLDSQLLLSLKANIDQKLMWRKRCDWQFPKFNQDLKNSVSQSKHIPLIKTVIFSVTCYVKYMFIICVPDHVIFKKSRAEMGIKNFFKAKGRQILKKKF
jgi:hypothetical protein